MATKTFDPDLGGNDLWDNPNNWSPYGTIPQPGDTAVVPGLVDISPGLLLYNITVQLGELMTGDAQDETPPLTLNHSTIKDTGDMGGGYVQVSVGTLSLDSMSFIDSNSGLVTFAIGAKQINNSGTIEAQGAGLNFNSTLGQGTDFVNNSGKIISNHGDMNLLNTSITGNGQITVSNGSFLDLAFNSSIASTQHINLGGQDATTLAIGSSSSVAAAISGFLPTDTIDLTDFPESGAFVVPTSTINPTLLVFNFTNPYAPQVASVSLIGNYAHDTFTVAPDHAGSGGTDITVHPTT